jgi:general secretion pathway protein K
MTRSAHRLPRRGFALLIVLWVLAGIATIAATAMLVARDGIAMSRNRLAASRAEWLAEGWTERARASIDAALSADSSRDGDATAWSRLDAVLASALSSATAACALSMVPVGARLPLNAATGHRLRRFFAASGVTPSRVDSLSDALLDWRDADDDERAFGAERATYIAAGRPPPRNAPLIDLRELRQVWGFDRLPPQVDTIVASHVELEDGRTDLSHASVPVLLSLPGITRETAEHVIALQRDGALPHDLLALAEQLSRESRDSLTAHYTELVSLTGMSPDAWIVSARCHSGEPPVTAVVELRLARSGRRAAIVRRRGWLE